jgi:hypothetical protein
MDQDQNWYRQLAALVLLSASRAAVEFVTNPGSRTDASKQLKSAFAEIDYDQIAKAVTRSIDDLASTSKGRLSETIDTIRDKSQEAVDEARSRAERQLAPKKKGRKMRFLVGLMLGGLIAYFLLDEQRRDDLLDKMTGASGPIQQSMPPSGNGASRAGDSDTGGSASSTESQSTETKAESNKT